MGGVAVVFGSLSRPQKSEIVGVCARSAVITVEMIFRRRPGVGGDLLTDAELR